MFRQILFLISVFVLVEINGDYSDPYYRLSGLRYPDPVPYFKPRYLGDMEMVPSEPRAITTNQTELPAPNQIKEPTPSVPPVEKQNIELTTAPSPPIVVTTPLAAVAGPSVVTTSPAPALAPVGGIIDIDANSDLLSFPNPFGNLPNFEFILPDLNQPSGAGAGIRFGGIFGLGNTNQWWKGKNVCIERQEGESEDYEEDSNDNKKTNIENATTTTTTAAPSNLFSTNIHFSNCYETGHKYECISKINNHGAVKTFTVRYKCCYGYKKLSDSEGCVKQGDLKPVLKTLEDVQANEFLRLIRSSGLEEKFANGNFTIFVPSDNAIQEYSDKITDINKIEVSRRRRRNLKALSSKDLVLSHTIAGFNDLLDVENDELLTSEDNQNSKIRMNLYSNQPFKKIWTANCAKITKDAVLAENGIVHVVDRVIPAVTESIQELIENNPKLTILRKALQNTNIPKNFKADGEYTFFAPTDEAFAKLTEVQRQKLLSGSGCATNILKHLLVDHTICSVAIVGNGTTLNIEHNYLNLERRANDEIIFEKQAKIVETDLMATNGVIHLIDTLIIPDSGQDVSNYLENHNFDKFYELIRKAGLESELDNTKNISIFAPANDAFETVEAKKLLVEIGDDKEKIKDLVLYHVIGKPLNFRSFTNNMNLITRDHDKGLRVNLYSTIPFFTNVIDRATFNCARLTAIAQKTCGATVRGVTKLLNPPTKSVYDIIQADDRYSTLRQILNGSDTETILRENNESFTFLAPTDEAFSALDDKDRKMLLEDKEKAEQVLKIHLLKEVLCCAGVGPGAWGFNRKVATYGDQRVDVVRNGSQVKVNKAVITQCDNMATNGIVHTINKVLRPRSMADLTLGAGLFLLDL